MDVCTSELPALDIPQQSGKIPLKRFSPKQEEVELLRNLLHKKTGRDDLSSTIILNANASDLLPVRRWPVRNYVKLGRQLICKYPKLRIVFTGAPNEADVADQLAEKVGSDRCISLAGKITFRQLMVLFTMGNLLLTNDSGPAHFATLTNIRILVLFGPETPTLFAPKGPQVHVVWKALACSPCVSAFNNRQTKCRNNICMQRISVECVFHKVCKIYEESLNKDLQELTNEFVIKPQRSTDVQIQELRSPQK
jgi:ADP-heptose:LPS heptosyltransferase